MERRGEGGGVDYSIIYFVFFRGGGGGGGGGVREKIFFTKNSNLKKLTFLGWGGGGGGGEAGVSCDFLFYQRIQILKKKQHFFLFSTGVGGRRGSGDVVGVGALKSK